MEEKSHLIHGTPKPSNSNLTPETDMTEGTGQLPSSAELFQNYACISGKKNFVCGEGGCRLVCTDSPARWVLGRYSNA